MCTIICTNLCIPRRRGVGARRSLPSVFVRIYIHVWMSNLTPSTPPRAILEGKAAWWNVCAGCIGGVWAPWPPNPNRPAGTVCTQALGSLPDHLYVGSVPVLRGRVKTPTLSCRRSQGPESTKPKSEHWSEQNEVRPAPSCRESSSTLASTALADCPGRKSHVFVVHTKSMLCTPRKAGRSVFLSSCLFLNPATTDKNRFEFQFLVYLSIYLHLVYNLTARIPSLS
jgi:hypothetical protein